MTMKNEQDSKQPAIPPLPPATGSAEMLELPNDTKIRFCNAFDAIKAHCILCKECDMYLRWGDGDLCSTGKAMIALEMCYTDTSIVFPPNNEVSGAGATASNANTKSATRQRSLD